MTFSTGGKSGRNRFSITNNKSLYDLDWLNASVSMLGVFRYCRNCNLYSVSSNCPINQENNPLHHSYTHKVGNPAIQIGGPRKQTGGPREQSGGRNHKSLDERASRIFRYYFWLLEAFLGCRRPF